MKIILAGLIVFIYATSGFADIYKYEDPDGMVHFSDKQSDPRFKLVVTDQKPLTLGPIIYKQTSGKTVYMVNSSSRKGYYYWLFGGTERALVMVQKDGSLAWNGRYLYRTGDEVRDKVDHRFVWLKGTSEFDCFVATKKHVSR
ncbi:DUF4124 domain-containing protein [Geomonas subterranea]|uniref:DUF4124 domain-containing protein n=1 Tax=Geomonas subterranea TaxID=2847989 RepID=UPI001CD5C30C|nr:DUF4124 domain-containing protein [Geomonas fuzhouensis]